MSEALNMAQVARRCSLSRERFRKVWRRWNLELAFPGPFLGGTYGEHYAWDSGEVDAWVTGRTRAFGQAAPNVANDEHPHDSEAAMVERQRARALQLMRRVG